MSVLRRREPGAARRRSWRATRAPKSAILPLAHLAQDQDGWLIARGDGTRSPSSPASPPADVQGTCSFYTMFKRRPCGKLLVSVCTNVTCLVDRRSRDARAPRGARTRTDPDVTVEEVECLAACGGAPAMQVNYEFHEQRHARVGARRSSRSTAPGTRTRAHDLGSDRV